ncbi:FadR/GntR family transcriptional regulator [Xylophilus sp. GOD-11R]|uniref:FadR/GntR family transcriptional regulator n=1 Tax=Xylophilus sp. GOD-11R TaxID=3089814 RepID=UPI00298C6545|nr:FadR/GntR family transcriptional regulator [Xylophilus sp. GOD-11R]WPB55591.1 FadR/GntR family transcriptional regulator [Xylophilus sp. GOD-11R]
MIEQLKQIDSRRLYQRIADQIRGLIDSGRYVPGARLPPERDLAVQLGVSRPSVREALIALELEGSVEVRMGAGVYVCTSPGDKPLSTAAMGESPTELMQARVVLEGTVVMMACARCTPEALAGLRVSIEGMRAAVSERVAPLHFDRQFHVGIAAMTGNTVLARLVGDLFDERQKGAISSQISERAESPQTWTEAVEEHEAVLRALEARDALAAHTAMCRHLSASQHRWTERGRQEWS